MLLMVSFWRAQQLVVVVVVVLISVFLESYSGGTTKEWVDGGHLRWCSVTVVVRGFQWLQKARQQVARVAISVKLAVLVCRRQSKEDVVVAVLLETLW